MKYKRGAIVIHNETIDTIEEALTFGARIVMGEIFEPVCTSGVDGNHSTNPESGHYQARALDFGFYGFVPVSGVLARVEIAPEKRTPILDHTMQRLTDLYGAGRYFGMLEDDHFHLQRNKNTF